jgi:hypothetical protein
LRPLGSKSGPKNPDSSGCLRAHNMYYQLVE